MTAAPPLHVVTVSCVRNEADIVETFVRYHCATAGLMVIADHESDDGTRAILEGLRDEGLPLEIHGVAGPAFPQAEILTGLIRKTALLHDPDWILPLDADEFVRGDLSRIGAARGPVRLPWQTYVPTPEDRRDANVLMRIVHRKAHEDPPFAKVLIPRAVASDPSFRIGEGSHFVAAPDVDAEAVDGLTLAHFPVRSSAQVHRKAGNYARRLLVPGRTTGESYHLARLADVCRDGRELSARDLQHLAATYAATGPVDESLVFDPIDPAAKRA